MYIFLSIIKNRIKKKKDLYKQWDEHIAEVAYLENRCGVLVCVHTGSCQRPIAISSRYSISQTV